MEPIIIENVLLNENRTNILIENSKITGIGTQIPMPVNAIRIDGKGKAAFPAFANMHTHAAMTLLKGMGSDMPLQQWLNESIWPAEKHLDGEAVYWGVKLACLEMIKGGTTLFNDMYFHLPHAAKAVAEMGIRGVLGLNVFGDGDELTDESFRQLRGEVEGAGELIKLSIAPHSVYTVSEKGLLHCAEMSRRHDTIFQIHMSETEHEVQECLSNHQFRPYALLEHLGVLGLTEGRFVGAHSLYLDTEEIDLMARHHITVTHNPASNLKLGSGYRFLYTEMRNAGVNVALGTDGSASSNNLDMIEAARLMSYLQKGVRQDPTVLPATELMQVVSENGFKAAGINAGRIEVGKVADLILVDLDNLAFVPMHDTLSGLFYAAHGDAVDTVVCNGRIVMRNRHVEGEEEIRTQARRHAQLLRVER